MRKTNFYKIILAFCLLCVCFYTGADNMADGKLPKEIAREKLLETLSGAAGLALQDIEVLRESEVFLKAAGKKVKLYKVFNGATGEGTTISVDEYNNAEDYSWQLKREKAHKYSLYGAVQPGFYEELKNMSSSSLVPVMIKFNVKEEALDRSEQDHPDKSRRDKAKKKAKDIVTKAKNEAGKLFQAIQTKNKLNYGTLKQYGPFVFTELEAGEILKLAKHPHVAFIGNGGGEIVFGEEPATPTPTPTIVPSIPESLSSIYMNNVHNIWGYKGAGVNLAVIEEGLLTENASLFNIKAQEVPFSMKYGGHMTMVVGTIGNNYNGTWEGYAPEASILLANGANYINAYNWAVSQDVNIVSMSWTFTQEITNGDMHARDIFFDYCATHYPYPSIFNSAGNYGEEEGTYASGKGYNFISVGNIVNDADGDRLNDVMASSSSWGNPISDYNDREVPQIAAPGNFHAVIGKRFGGTSCATPISASTAAVVMERTPDLKQRPEAIRAILMATANYQGADGKNWATYSDGKDGAGLISAHYAVQTSMNRGSGAPEPYRGYDYGTLTPGSFTGSTLNQEWSAFTNTTASKIRVVFTWASKTTETSSVLDADLDLYVYDPNGYRVASSTSWDNNNEFVEFVPVVTGKYTIRVKGYSIPADFNSNYGVAWTTHYAM